MHFLNIKANQWTCRSTRTHHSDSKSTSHCSFFMFSREPKHTNFMVFCLFQPRHEAMIYHTQGKHANHYTTDSVLCLENACSMHIKDNLQQLLNNQVVRCDRLWSVSRHKTFFESFHYIH
jgi:hypothetical protein